MLKVLRAMSTVSRAVLRMLEGMSIMNHNAQSAQDYEQYEHQNEAQVYKIETRHP